MKDQPQSDSGLREYIDSRFDALTAINGRDLALNATLSDERLHYLNAALKTITDNCEQRAAVLEATMNERLRYGTQRFEHLETAITSGDAAIMTLMEERRGQFQAGLDALRELSNSRLRMLDDATEQRRREREESAKSLEVFLLTHIQSNRDQTEIELKSLDDRLRDLAQHATDDLATGKATLDERIVAVDSALRGHINLQIDATKLALAADKESTKLALESLLGLLAERDKALNNRREEQREAESKASVALDLRLEGMNQFRRQIEQERGDYVRRDAWTQALTDRDLHFDERFSVIAQQVSRAADDRQKIRDDLNAVTIRQATEDRGKGEGRQRVDLYFTGAGVLISVLLGVVAIILHFVA